MKNRIIALMAAAAMTLGTLGMTGCATVKVDTKSETKQSITASVNSDEAKAPASEADSPAKETAGSEKSSGIYNVHVVDQNGKAVENAGIQFCDNQSCTVKNTDSDGNVSFRPKDGSVQIHVLDVPAGYSASDKEVKVEEGKTDYEVIFTQE